MVGDRRSAWLCVLCACHTMTHSTSFENLKNQNLSWWNFRRSWWWAIVGGALLPCVKITQERHVSFLSCSSFLISLHNIYPPLLNSQSHSCIQKGSSFFIINICTKAGMSALLLILLFLTCRSYHCSSFTLEWRIALSTRVLRTNQGSEAAASSMWWGAKRAIR